MKHQILTLAFFLLIGTITTTFAQQNDSTTIKITLSESEEWLNNRVAVTHTNPVFRDLKKTLFFIQTDKSKNEWVGKILIKTPQPWRMSIGNKWVFDILLLPKDDVEIVLDEKGAAKFLKGKIAKESESTYDWWSEYQSKIHEFALFSPEIATQKIDSMTNSYLSIYEKAFEKAKPNLIFDNYFRTELNLSQFNAWNNYPELRYHYSDRKYMPEETRTEEYKANIPKPVLDLNSEYPFTTEYILYAYNYFLDNECSYNEEDKRIVYTACKYENFEKIQQIDREAKKLFYFMSVERVMQYLTMADMFSMSEEEKQEFKVFLDKLVVEAEEKYADSEELIFVEKQIALNAKMAIGSPAPNFSLKDKDGKTVSLADLKGKYVMIDFWATWCQPCLAEIPHSMKLEEEFSDDVTFVYVCMSSKEDKWKEMIAEKPAQQVQLFVEGEAQKQMSDDYQVSFYPTYILLDREGKIITKNIRPSQNGKEVLKETIEAEK